MGHGQGGAIAKKYDKRSLFFMLLKFYHHLHPLFEVESSFVDKNYEDTSLDVFEMVVSTNEPRGSLLFKNVLYFEDIKWMEKTSNAFWNGGGENEFMFPIIILLVWQIWGIVSFQIEIERIFFLANILTNLKSYHLQSNNLEKLIFVNKNQLNDAKVDCKVPFNLVELIDSK